MFLKEEKPIIDPFLIKRHLDFKSRTFNVNPLTYQPESGWILLLDLETKELYNGHVLNNQIEVSSKGNLAYIQSYDEFIHLTYSKKTSIYQPF